MLTTGAISRPKTATKFDSAAGNGILGTNMTINEKTKHALQIMANLDKKAKIGFNRLIERSVFRMGRYEKMASPHFFNI